VFDKSQPIEDGNVDLCSDVKCGKKTERNMFTSGTIPAMHGKTK
jgi:hypothetical protein